MNVGPEGFEPSLRRIGGRGVYVLIASLCTMGSTESSRGTGLTGDPDDDGTSRYRSITASSAAHAAQADFPQFETMV